MRFLFPLKLRAALAGGAVCTLLLSAAPTQAGLFDDNEARRAILDLQSRVNALENQLSATPRALLDQSNRLEQLQQQVAALRGQIETLNYQFSIAQQEIKRTDPISNQHLQSIKPSQPTADEVQEVAQSSENEDFNAALQHFRSGQLKRAISLFKSFIEKYPNSPYQPTAQYWLGNTLYAQREYKSAIATLERVVKQYPTHPRAPEALLAIAQSQLEQGQKSGARKTLQQIVEQYSHAEAAQSARHQLKQLL